MEFIDDEARPRFLFQSRSVSATETQNQQQKSKSVIIISVSFSLLLLALSLFFLKSDLLKFLFLWFSVSFLVGPFAPRSFTGGDIGVGRGEVVEFPQENQSTLADDSKRKGPNKRQKPKRSDDLGLISTEPSSSDGNASDASWKGRNLDGSRHNSTNGVSASGNSAGEKVALRSNGNGAMNEESEWTEEDFDLLRKQIVKHPTGKPRRWEVITEAFKGRHSVQSVIKMSKSTGEAKPEDSDSYSKFLRNRKPVDKRIDESVDDGLVMDSGGKKKESNEDLSIWSSGEDIALLNALKAFPKDVPMRWEKIAAAVPGKPKAACMKRVSVLKKDFRSSKAVGEN